jgi:hypothetical protein
MDEPHRKIARFPADREQLVRKRFDTLLRVLAPEGIVTSAAAGADLILVESALDRSLPVHLVLPFERTEFRKRSVSDRGSRWERSFDEALDAAIYEPQNSLVSLDLPVTEKAFRTANHAIIERGESLAPGHVLAVAVRNRSGEDPPSVTDDFVRQAETNGLFVIEIDPLDTPL